MNSNEILALYDQEQRIEVKYPDLRKENVGEVIRFIGKPQLYPLQPTKRR